VGVDLTENDLVGDPELFDEEERQLHARYLEVKESLIPGAGLGVFAKEDVPKDTWVGTMAGKVVGTNAKHVLFNAQEDGFILVAIAGPLRYANHSPEPSLYMEEGAVPEETWLYTSRDVKAGEELTWDYNFEDEELAGEFEHGDYETDVHEMHPLSVVAWLQERDLLGQVLDIVEWLADQQKD